jgi:uncharacterized membrane protein
MGACAEQGLALRLGANCGLWPVHGVMSILISLALVGLLISTYFTAVAYRWVRPDVRWVPFFCRMDEQTCASIVFTPQARIFFIPNSVLGQLYYLAIVLGVVFGWIDGPLPLPLSYIVASALTVSLGAYLSYALLFVNRVVCPLCFTSHSINLVIFLLLVLRG